MAYGGESNAKKIARLEAWAYLSDWGPCGNALFLCGPRGADVTVALAHGWKPEQLVAVDTDPVALESARHELGELGKGVNFYLGSMTDAAAEADEVGALFFDACAPAVHVSKALAPGIASALSGSECSHRTGQVTFRGVRIVFGGMYGRDFRWMNGGTHHPPDSRRAREVARDLALSMSQEVSVFTAEHAWSYHSHRVCDDGVIRGVPMVHVGGFAGRTDCLGWVEQEVQGGGCDGGPRATMVTPRQRRRIAKKLGRKMKRKVNRRHGSSMPISSIGSDVDGIQVKRLGVKLASRFGSAKAALLLCLPEGTVRAWLAHSTRGTYG